MGAISLLCTLRCLSMGHMRKANRLLAWILLITLFHAVAQSQTRRALLIAIGNYAPPVGTSVAVPPAGHAADSRFAPGTPWPNLHGPQEDVTSMQVLLKEKFGFQNINVLPEQQATRQGILAAIEQLAAETRPGDFDVIYYAGHGSRRLDTLSSKDHFDETIVPVDAWKGAADIRDKELAVRFNRIVYEKKAHLTAIFDSCNSGTMARGVTATVVRALPYDDRDVALEKTEDPATVVEADLKQIPQNGDAIIVAAAAPNEPASEALYGDDRRWHGAFSRALAQVLRSNTQTLSAADVVAQVSNMLHADNMFQQPSLEGRVQQSLFGAPVADHPLRVHALKAVAGTVTLDMGSAAGFDTETQFTAVEPTANGEKTVLEVVSIDEPLVSTAKVIKGPATVKPGQVFDLSKMMYPLAARLVIFTPKPESDAAATAAKAKQLFPGLEWVDDPTDVPIDYLVWDGSNGLHAYSQQGRVVPPGAEASGTAFLLLGLPASLRAAIEQTAPFQRNAFAFTQNPGEANYLLAMRQRPGAAREYAFLDRNVLAPHSADAWVHSIEEDPEDVKLNGGTPPEVVCRNDTSLPVRSAWLPDTDAGTNDLVVALNRRIMRLGKLRVFLQLTGTSPGVAAWPYHLTVTSPNSDTPITGILHFHQPYEVRVTTTPAERAAVVTNPKHVYLFGFDCGANPFLLYPKPDLNGDAAVPQPGRDGVFGLSVSLGVRESVDYPLGADTLFLMVTAENLTDPSILVWDGVVDSGSRGVSNPFDALINDLSDATTRGPRGVPMNWQIQSLVLPSRR